MNIMRFWFSGAAFLMAGIFACSFQDNGYDIRFLKRIQPGKHFSEFEPPPAPDYSDPSNWGCLPDRDGDPCDQVPENSFLVDKQSSALADCFAVYPTTFFRGYGWNARVDDRFTRWLTDVGSLKKQFSVFNGSCRIFAPYYRQAHLGAFTKITGDPDQVASINLASEDVLAAFQYYLDNYDVGNPIVIAGHSQGVRHAIKILKEYFDNRPLMDRLVAGYLIGGNLHMQSLAYIPVCSRENIYGCVLGWRTAQYGMYTNEPMDTCINCKENGYDFVCVNPLDWGYSGLWVKASENLGGVPTSFDRVDPQITGAQCYEGTLWVKPIKTKGYFSIAGNYHFCDYSLFYMNIRQHVAEQIRLMYGLP